MLNPFHITGDTPKQIHMQDIGNLQVELQTERETERSFLYACGALLTFAILLFFGLTMLYSASFVTKGTEYFAKQIFWAVVGVFVGGAVFIVGYRRLSDYSLHIIGIVCILLIIAGFFMREVNGANRWIFISIAGREFSLQPSELAKPALLLYITRYCADNLRTINNFNLLKPVNWNWRYFRNGPLPAMMVCGVLCLLVRAGDDLGTTLLLGATMMAILLASGFNPYIGIGAPIAAGVGLFFYLKNFDAMRWARLSSFLHPELDTQGDAYQLWLSLLALGSGKWRGVGFMDSRLKQKYLPEHHTDFILSIVGEELGFISLVAVIATYLILALFGAAIAINARTRQGMLLAYGVVMLIVMQGAINIGVVSGAFPTKGIPAPLISYGGSNLLMSLILLGFLMSVAVDTAIPDFYPTLHKRLEKYIPHWLWHKEEVKP